MTLNELHRAVEYQFAALEKSDLYQRYRGWWPVWVRLCRQVDEVLGPNKRGFHWVQVKEKFGSARFYWQLANGDTSLYGDALMPGRVAHLTSAPSSELGQQIQQLVRAAQEDTKHRCIACGKPGALGYRPAVQKNPRCLD